MTNKTNRADIEIHGYRELHPCHLPHEEGLSDHQLIPIIKEDINQPKPTKNEERLVTTNIFFG